MTFMQRRWAAAGLVLLAAAHAQPARSQPSGHGKSGEQTYPSRPVRLIDPFPPGGGTSIMAHMLGQELLERWGHSLVVDNRGGAGGAIGTEMAARAAPDGYTLLIGTASTLVINPLVTKVAFDPIKDFAPVVHTAIVPLILVTHPSVPVKSVKELIAYAQAQPGKLNFASSGTGTISHLAGELFKTMTRVNIVHVPYRGGGPARNDVMAGQVQLNFANMLSALPFAKTGKLRALAISTSKRSAVAPDLPTLAESGVPGYEVVQWNGLFAPARTPRAIVLKINADIGELLQRGDIRGRILADGGEPVGGTPEQFGNFLKADIARWAKPIRSGSIWVER
jgi:tripartite-type tricarboxylate transporter receptor subunit TctC